MRIAVDVSDISPRRGKSRGIYSYARLLVEAMCEALPDGDTLVVLCNGDARADFERLAGSRCEVALVHHGFPSVVRRVLWCFGAGAWAVRRQRADVFFSPKGYAPLLLRGLAGVRLSVVTIHDLIPLWYARNHPSAFGRLERLFVNGWLVHSARHADRVVAISQATADALARELGRTEGVSVVRNAVPVLPAPTEAPERRHILAMTSSLPHKNLSGILAAYRAYRSRVERPLPLVVCGAAADLGEGVTGLVDRTAADLANLYATARAFLFLPFIEGFGFPVAEALSFGTPVVCSDIPALREASRGDARFVAPDDADACADALRAALVDPLPKLDGGRLPISVPDGGWARCARQTMAVWQTAARDGASAAGDETGAPGQKA